MPPRNFHGQDGVYDITDFVEMHPGGSSFIMMAAGGAVDPFWQINVQESKELTNKCRCSVRNNRLHSCKQPRVHNPHQVKSVAVWVVVVVVVVVVLIHFYLDVCFERQGRTAQVVFALPPVDVPCQSLLVLGGSENGCSFLHEKD
eukprot:scaffold39848_cov16-Tisochrysis_lutea.AAC.1